MKTHHPLIAACNALSKAIEQSGGNAQPALDMLLHLTFAADAAREEIYRPLQTEAHLSEGKLLLLTVLHRAGGEMSSGMLAHHLGVTDATVSIMVSRMLKESEPLVVRRVSKLDRRAVVVSITPAGEDLLKSVLPRYSADIVAFSQSLTRSEQLLLTGLLKKLITSSTKTENY